MTTWILNNGFSINWSFKAWANITPWGFVILNPRGVEVHSGRMTREERISLVKKERARIVDII